MGSSTELGIDPSYPVTKKCWFAVFTTPRHEKRVTEHFRIRQIENFLPLYQKQRQWKDGSKGVLELPLFLNYTFVRISRAERMAVLQVPGVMYIVGGGREPMPISDIYIERLQQGLRHHKIEPHPYLITGMRVRIHSGPMAGAEGVLVRKKNDVRVVLTLEMIMKSVMVEVEMNNIEPISAHLTSVPHGKAFHN